jgi:hypothetical protein
MKINALLLTLIVVLVSACQPEKIGGQKDEYGCLTPAGYSWNSTIGACVRPWELDESQAKAAQIVVMPMSIRPVTVVSVETLRCPGCFIVNLLVGDNEKAYPVKLINWKVSYEISSFEECVAAGNPVMESYPRRCAAGDKTFTEEIKHICTAEESSAQACTMEYAPVCGEFLLNTGKTVYQTFGNGCTACATMKVVGYTQGECGDKETEIKYLSTSAEQCSKMGIWLCDEGYSVFTDETGCGCKKEPAKSICSDEKGNTMPIDKAHDIAVNSECGDNLIFDCTCPAGYKKEGTICNPNCYYSNPRCLAPSIQCEKTYFCNEGTGTFWINMNITKKGCNPACVINLETNQAEINWRCTGLLPN